MYTVSGSHRRPVRGLDDRRPDTPRQALRQGAGKRRRHVLHDQNGQRDAAAEIRQQRVQRPRPAGGGSDQDGAGEARDAAGVSRLMARFSQLTPAARRGVALDSPPGHEQPDPGGELPAQLHEVGVGRRAARFSHEVEGARLKRPHRHVGAAAREGADHDDADLRRRRPRGVEPLDLRQGLKTIQTRHLHVQRRHVRRGRAQELQRLLAAEDGADDDDAFLASQRLGQRGAEDARIVHDQHPRRLGHRIIPRSGTRRPVASVSPRRRPGARPPR